MVTFKIILLDIPLLYGECIDAIQWLRLLHNKQIKGQATVSLGLQLIIVSINDSFENYYQSLI